MMINAFLKRKNINIFIYGKPSMKVCTNSRYNIKKKL